MSDDELYGCGYEYDHTVRELGEGHWECTECGAEGWPEEVPTGQANTADGSNPTSGASR